VWPSSQFDEIKIYIPKLKRGFPMSYFTLTNVRLSFPNLFDKATYNGNETKYEATFLISKDDKKTLDLIRAKTKEALLEKYTTIDKIPKGITKGIKNCLRDGDDADYDGYEGHMSFKASHKSRPRTLDRKKVPIEADSGLLYAGCYVDAIVEIWIQDNQYGARINANLLAVRHREDGEAFGSGSIPQGVEDAFEDLEDEELDELEEEDLADL